MLSTLTISLEKDKKISYNSGSAMQGLLMEQIPTEYAERLHAGGINPYSQHLSFREDCICWQISTMTKEARENIILPLLNCTEKNLTVKHLDTDIKIIQKELKEMTFDELMEETYFGRCTPYLTLDFVTPTAFKAGGKCQFYPTTFHLFQSLAKKYDAVSGETEIFSEELMKEIEEHLFVTGYNLRSCAFSLEGIKIPAFKGQLTLKSRGPQMFTNLIHMLACFGVFSGVGIKTAMGMGAMTIKEQSKRTE